MIETQLDQVRQSARPSTSPSIPRDASGKINVTPEVVFAAFALLEKLDTGRRRPPPSVWKVFRLYCADLLSVSQVARECRCSKSAVVRRLQLINKVTGLPIAILRNPYPQPGFIADFPADTSVARMNGQNILYAGFDTDSFPE